MQIPDIVLVCCNHFEIVIAWFEIEVAGNAFMCLFPPSLVSANQPIAEAHPLRRHERIGSVFELDHPPVARSNPYSSSSRREQARSISGFGFRASNFERGLLTPVAAILFPINQLVIRF